MVRWVAFVSSLCAAAMLFLVVYNVLVQPPLSHGPVERWIEIGFERSRLEGLNGATVLISPEQYEADRQRLQSEELEILAAGYPESPVEYQAYQQERRHRMGWPAFFWIALATAIATSIAALSWLAGARHTDRWHAEGSQATG